MPELETLLPNSPGIPAVEMRFESQAHIRWQQRENFTFSWLFSCFLSLLKYLHSRISVIVNHMVYAFFLFAQL